MKQFDDSINIIFNFDLLFTIGNNSVIILKPIIYYKSSNCNRSRRRIRWNFSKIFHQICAVEHRQQLLTKILLIDFIR